jgi:peptidoglycan/LPS O-acetylase OafA/YrhL
MVGMRRTRRNEIHSFFQFAFKRWVFAHGHPSHGYMAMFMVGVSPIAVAASYGFHVLFERPFMSQRRQLAEEVDRIETVQSAI